MTSAHPDTELVALAAESLPAASRERVAAHVTACPECRRAVAEYRALLAGLADGLPDPPPVSWVRYRAELRGRLEARRARSSWFRGAGWVRSLQVGLSAGLAVGLLALTVLSAGRPGHVETAPLGGLTFDARVLGARFDLLRQYAVVERLDLLEDLEVILPLDRLEPAREG